MTSLQLCASHILTPLGADTTMAWAAMDAGLSAYQHCSIFGQDDPEIIFAPIPDEALDALLPTTLPGLSAPQKRLIKIAATALDGLIPELPPVPLPLFLAGPEPYYQPSPVNRRFIDYLTDATGLQLDKTNSRYLGSGRCGVIEAIQTAAKALQSTDSPYALIGGIDSFYDPRTLSILQRDDRLAGNGRFDGFVPGEAAGFLLVSRADRESGADAPSRLTLAPPALSYEAGHLRGDQPYTAEALASACLQAAAELGEPIDTLFSPENGEHHYHRELAVAWIRLQRRLVANAIICRPAEYLGDLGAAYGAIAIALAGERIRTGESQHALICASSDGGPRGAVTLSGANPN